MKIVDAWRLVKSGFSLKYIILMFMYMIHDSVVSILSRLV